MSEQRLSKLQKWILENCFRVTVLLDRTRLEKLNNAGSSRECRGCPKTDKSVRLERDKSNNITVRCVIKSSIPRGAICDYFEFYKEDILLSFFMLEPNNDIDHFDKVQHFHDSRDYAKIHVTVHRSIKNLIKKGYIYIWSAFAGDSMRICLTEDGMEKAAVLLNIRDYKRLINS